MRFALMPPSESTEGQNPAVSLLQDFGNDRAMKLNAGTIELPTVHSFEEVSIM
jgi:hypothetical protein